MAAACRLSQYQIQRIFNIVDAGFWNPLEDLTDYDRRPDFPERASLQQLSTVSGLHKNAGPNHALMPTPGRLGQAALPGEGKGLDGGNVA